MSLSGILTFTSPHFLILFCPPGEQKGKLLSNLIATERYLQIVTIID